MATKTQNARTAIERAKQPKKKKAPPKPVKRARGAGHADTRNESKHAGRNGGVVLEESVGKSSRKSTRKSVDHTKRTTSLQLKAQRKHVAPSARTRSKG